MFSSRKEGSKSGRSVRIDWAHWGDRCRDIGLALAVWFLPITISLAELGAVLCLAGLIVGAGSTRASGGRRLPPRLGEEGWMLGFAAACLVAAVASPERWARLAETHVLLWIALGYGAASAWGRADAPAPAERRVRAALLLPRRVEEGWSAFAVGAAALGCWVLVWYPWKAWGEGVELKLLGNMRDGQLFMVALLESSGALLWRGRGGGGRRFWLALLPLHAGGLWINLKRGSWISFAVGFALQAWHRARRAVLITGAVMAAVLALLPASRARIVELGGELDPARGGRFGMWTRAAPPLIRDHPLGVGLGGTPEALLRGYYPELEADKDHLHNNVLQVLAEAGWLGGVLWCGWMIAAGRRMWRSYRTFRRAGAERESVWALVLVTAFIALMVNGLVEYNFGDSEIALLLYLVMGSSRALDLRWQAGRGVAGAAAARPAGA